MGDNVILTFINNYNIFEVPSRFSYQHVVYLLVDILYIIGLIFLLRKKDQKVIRTVLIILSSICCLIFMGRMFFGWEGSRIFEKGSKTTLLPLELCNINIFITLIALIVNKKFLNNYLYFVSLVGGIIPLLVFPDVHMITSGRNIFHYMFFDYWIIHTHLVAIPIVMISCKLFTPSIKQIPWVLLTTLGIYFIAFLSSIILRNFESFKTANYMYTMSHNNLPILKQLYSLIPIPFIYGLPLIIPITGVLYLMGLPFIKRGEKNVNKHS